jgi:hypothetical protein
LLGFELDTASSLAGFVFARGRGAIFDGADFDSRFFVAGDAFGFEIAVG